MNDKEQMAEVQILSPRLKSKAGSKLVQALPALFYILTNVTTTHKNKTDNKKNLWSKYAMRTTKTKAQADHY